MLNANLLETSNAGELDVVFYGFGEGVDYTQLPKEKSDYVQTGIITPQRRSVDPTAVAGAISGAGALVGALKKDKTELERDIKAVCGKKPILKKNRAKYDECAGRVMQSKTTSAPVDYSRTYGSPEATPKKKFLGMPMGLGIAVTVVALAGISFVVYKYVLKK